MLAVTLLLDRDLGLGHPVRLPGADVSSQTVTVRQRRTARYPPLWAGHRLEVDHEADAQIGGSVLGVVSGLFPFDAVAGATAHVLKPGWRIWSRCPLPRTRGLLAADRCAGHWVPALSRRRAPRPRSAAPAGRRSPGKPAGRSLLAAHQEVQTCPFTSASALAIACPSLVAAAGATLPASVSATGAVESGLVRLRATAAAAPAAAVSTEMPASLRQRARRGLAGSSRRAATDNQAETVGATLCCTTRPVRSTRGAAQARVVRMRRITTAPALWASGLI